MVYGILLFAYWWMELKTKPKKIEQGIETNKADHKTNEMVYE